MACLLLTLGSCSVNRHIPENSYLLDQARISSGENTISTDELQTFMPQQPNSRWFSLFRVPLRLYCLSGQDSTKRINRFLHHIGEAPVIYDRDRTLRMMEFMQLAVRNKGYLNADVELRETSRGNRMKAEYHITPHERYRIRRFRFIVEDETLVATLDSLGYQPNLATDKPFDLSAVDDERGRLYSLLINNGYYRFNKEYIRFHADTAVGLHLVDLDMTVQRCRTNADSADVSHHRYHFGPIHYSTEDDPEARPFIRSKVIDNAMAIQTDSLYREENIHETYSRLTRLSAVLASNIRIEETRPGSDTLAAEVTLMPNKPNSFKAELEGTNSAGDLGAAVALSYQNRNLLHGSESFGIKLRGAFEAIKGLSGYADQNFIEYSAETSLAFPDFKLPFLRSSFRGAAQATTELGLSFDSQDRPEFHRRVLTAALRYRWNRWNRQLQHRIDLLDINYVFMPWISDTFRQLYLDDPQNRNAILRYNYENLFIMKWGYQFVYNSRQLNAATSNYGTNAYTIRLGIETAGNLLYGISNLTNAKHDEEGQYRYLNIPYAQYAKLDFSFSKSFVLGRGNSLALHAGLGIAYAYGNSTILPYEKRYFSGGANSVRGWSVRELGPGSFVGNDGRIDFINQTGDMKLDLNLEYRSHLFWKFDGAAFIDAGNIWTLRNYAEQPGGQFHFDSFWRQIAVAYGLGLRLNFDYFILRLDGGMKAIHPAYEDAERHYPIIHPNFKRDFTFHFAVGLPF